MAENFLRSAILNKHFFYSAELVLGRDHSVAEAEGFVRDAGREADGVRIISITDLPGGNPALPPESFVPFVQEQGLTPLAHLAAKDGNRAFLEGRLHGLARMGVENILALTGDAQKDGFWGRSRPVYDLDSVLLLCLIDAMREGIPFKVGSRSIRTTPFEFFPGAVVNPFKTREPDLMMQLFKLQLKILCGARFVITQIGYNLRKLCDLKEYLERIKLPVPVVANVYVPTTTIATMMRNGEVAGCVIPEELTRRLEKEKKPQRLERAALMMAAVRDLGFAGSHIGGFGLSHSDYMLIISRSQEIGSDWRKRMDELVLPCPDEFYLFDSGPDGLSDSGSEFRCNTHVAPVSLVQCLSRTVHDHLISEHSWAGKFLRRRLGQKTQTAEDLLWRRGFWYGLIGVSTLYRKAALGCAGCGDCIQDHLNYAGCTVGLCQKGLRNGPCGGSRMDGTCEAHPERPCRWNEIYRATVASGDDPSKFAETLIPPRDWKLDGTNAMANRLVDLDNYTRREKRPKK